MQTPKTSGSTKSSSGSEGGRRIISPRGLSLETTKRSSGRVVGKLKTTGFEPTSSTSQPIVKSPRTASPKTIDRPSPRGPLTYELPKNRLGRIAELEAQVTQLEDALSTVKDQLIVSESWKKQAKLDAEESRKELLAMTLKLEESQELLTRSSSNEDTHEPNSTNSAALAAALLEIDQLKVKLDTTSESEVTQTKLAESAYEEIRILKENMAETFSAMDEMKNQLEDCRISESQAHKLASETLLQLETAKKTMESLKFSSGEYDAMVLELEHSRARIISLEGIIDMMKKTDQQRESESLISRQTLEIIAELNRSKADIEELKANMMDKETELQCVLEENDDLNKKLANLMPSFQENKLENESKLEVNDSKSKVTNLETELSEKSDENEMLKLEIKTLNSVMNGSKHDFNDFKSKLTSLEIELRKKSDENEKLKLEISKINSVIHESKQDFNNLKSKSVILEAELREKSDDNEKLKLEIKKKDNDTEAVTRSKCEIEEELRKLKVQMGQWRKAAEAATAMLCDEDNGGMVEERTWSMGHYSPMNISSPCSVDIDDDDDEFMRRKNGNMLKRIGVLWKKQQSK